jgi:hypothetical protein
LELLGLEWPRLVRLSGRHRASAGLVVKVSKGQIAEIGIRILFFFARCFEVMDKTPG